MPCFVSIFLDTYDLKSQVKIWGFNDFMNIMMWPHMPFWDFTEGMSSPLKHSTYGMSHGHIWDVFYWKFENVNFQKNDIKRDVKSEKMITHGARTTKGTEKLITYGMSKMKENRVWNFLNS